MSKKVIANQLIDDTKHPFMGNESTSKKNLFVKKKFSAKTVEIDIHQKYSTVLNMPIQNLKKNHKTKTHIVKKHQIDQTEVSKQKLMSTQEKLSTDELRNIPIMNKLTDLLKKTELENKIIIQNMLNFQEKLSLSELENEKLKTELLNLKEIKIAYERIKHYEIENKIIFKNMLNTQEELSRYKIENDLLKNKLEISTSHPIEKIAVPQSKLITQQQKNIKLIGAKYRIQNDLPYQIGKTMIDCSKTLNGSIKMPFMVYQKIKAIEDNNHTLPPLSEYNDVDEVELVKKHLSYRLGNIVINTIDNPKDIFKLPVKIGTEILKFKLKK